VSYNADHTIRHEPESTARGWFNMSICRMLEEAASAAAAAAAAAVAIQNVLCAGAD